MRRSLYFTKPGKVSLKTEKIPMLEEGECLIRHKFSLISPGTELALLTKSHVGFSDPDIQWARYPILPGYAAVGTVITSLAGDQLRVGDNIMYHGSHSSHGILRPSNGCWIRSDNGSDEARLFARFAQISSTVPYLASAKKGNVLVLGAGIIGNFCAQLFLLEGQREVIIADLSERRLNIACECGIKNSINTRECDPIKGIKTICQGKGVDIVVEATGVPELVSRSLELVNPLGSVYLLGSPRGEVILNAYKYIHRKGLSLIGAHESVPASMEKQGLDIYKLRKLEEMASLIDSGKLKTQAMLTHRIRPEDAQDAYHNLLHNRDEYFGVIIDWMDNHA